MRMRDNLIDIYKVLTTDETLLRLLFYLPENANDHPLDETEENILDKEIGERWEIIQDRIKKTPNVSGLDEEPKCRILFYPGRRRTTGNYLVANQIIVMDVLAHYYYEDVDMRNSWICDRLNELMFDKRITGLGKINFVDGNQISAPENYVGYRLTYAFGSSKKGSD